jgi:AmmeMemoRadiSam system protein A
MDEVYIPLPSQRKLLGLARQTLEAFVRNTLRPRAEIADPYLQIRGHGVFVSLHKKGELRGCLGAVAGGGSLYETVLEMTEAAASRDRRVKPVGESVLDEINIGISILSPLKAIHDPLSLKIGKHGLYIVQGSRHGILLPQVAAEYHWKIQTFLEEVCIKAGLRKDAWQAYDTELSSFTALVIEEPPWNVAVLSDS